MLSTWVEVNSNENVVVDCIPSYKKEAQRLWNNNINCKGKPLFSPQWIKADIYKLGHLFNEAGEFLTMREKANIVGKSPSIWFEYNALLNAIHLKLKGKNLMFPRHQYSHDTGISSIVALWEKSFNLNMTGRCGNPNAVYQRNKTKLSTVEDSA